MIAIAVIVYNRTVPLAMPSPSPTTLPVHSATPSATPTPSATTKQQPPQVLLDVPFVVQAPTGHWADMRQENACEEASAMMAMHWVRGTTVGTATQTEAAIIAIAEHEMALYGTSTDTSTTDTVTRIFKAYFHYDNVRVKTEVTVEAIKTELAAGRLVLVPANGQILANPHYVQPGPLQHMLVITGYDDVTGEFITNDPGTRYGQGYRYPQTRLLAAIYDYPTGEHESVTSYTKSMIVVERLSTEDL